MHRASSSLASTEEFSRKSSRLSKSGIEIWKFLTSYIRALVGRSLFSFSLSPPGASILIGLPLAFPYPHTSAHTNAGHVHTRTLRRARRHSSHSYHIFLHIMPLFSEAHLSAKGRKVETKSLRTREWGDREDDAEILYRKISSQFWLEKNISLEKFVWIATSFLLSFD